CFGLQGCPSLSFGVLDVRLRARPTHRIPCPLGAEIAAAVSDDAARLRLTLRSLRRQLVRQLRPLAFDHGSHFIRDVVDVPLDIEPVVYIHTTPRNCVLRSGSLYEDSCLCHRTRMASRAVTRFYDDNLRSVGL